MDNPTGQIIEKLEMGSDEVSVSMAESGADKPNIVRPSSLNYKISLLEAVQSFQTKDKQEGQNIEVEIEEPVSKKMQNFDILDDALYTISKAQIQASQAANKNNMQNKNARQKTEAAAQWDKEEEQIRRKLERTNINMMKQRVLQQNRQD